MNIILDTPFHNTDFYDMGLIVKITNYLWTNFQQFVCSSLYCCQYINYQRKKIKYTKEMQEHSPISIHQNHSLNISTDEITSECLKNDDIIPNSMSREIDKLFKTKLNAKTFKNFDLRLHHKKFLILYRRYLLYNLREFVLPLIYYIVIMKFQNVVHTIVIYFPFWNETNVWIFQHFFMIFLSIMFLRYYITNYIYNSIYCLLFSQIITNEIADAPSYQQIRTQLSPIHQHKQSNSNPEVTTTINQLSSSNIEFHQQKNNCASSSVMRTNLLNNIYHGGVIFYLTMLKNLPIIGLPIFWLLSSIFIGQKLYDYLLTRYKLCYKHRVSLLSSYNGICFGIGFFIQFMVYITYHTISLIIQTTTSINSNDSLILSLGLWEFVYGVIYPFCILFIHEHGNDLISTYAKQSISISTSKSELNSDNHNCNNHFNNNIAIDYFYFARLNTNISVQWFSDNVVKHLTKNKANIYGPWYTFINLPLVKILRAVFLRKEIQTIQGFMEIEPSKLFIKMNYKSLCDNIDKVLTISYWANVFKVGAICRVLTNATYIDVLMKIFKHQRTRDKITRIKSHMEYVYHDISFEQMNKMTELWFEMDMDKMDIDEMSDMMVSDDDNEYKDNKSNKINNNKKKKEKEGDDKGDGEVVYIMVNDLKKINKKKESDDWDLI
jgi:hypothetical protein